jgi:alpha-N-arabinofuranosidase
MMTQYSNPVIPGFHPDPSVCRAGDDFYLVTSSFEYFPGVPLFHSGDLVNWRQIGHCLTRCSQLDLEGTPSSRGIYAPVIRYHQGRFYMITTHVTGGGHFFVFTDDPDGEWSDPVWIDCAGIDPSLFFDDVTGKVYFQCAMGSRDGVIVQSEIDLGNGHLNELRPIWKGTGGQYAEAPHLYRIHGRYYLMIAEGGTEYGHMETIARSDSPWGPFEAAPHNPILTHRSTPSPIQATGHADLIEAGDGSWWLVCLGIRPVWGHYHNLGRETFIAPVRWTDDGWPVVGDNGMIPEQVHCQGETANEAPPVWQCDNFDGAGLAPCWNFLRNSRPGSWSLTEQPGSLRLHGGRETLDCEAAPAFVGRRQYAWRMRVRVAMRFDPQQDGQYAGVTVYKDHLHHYDCCMVRVNGQNLWQLKARIGPLKQVIAETPATATAVMFCVETNEFTYRFSLEAGDETQPLGELDARYLSTEVSGGFTGVFFAMFAVSGNGQDAAPADFDWFELKEME